MKQRGAPLLCAAAILTIITQIAAHADRPGFKGDCRDVSHYPSHLSPEAKHNRLLRDEVADILSEYLDRSPQVGNEVACRFPGSRRFDDHAFAAGQVQVR